MSADGHTPGIEDIGQTLALEVIFGDGAVALPAVWPQLTGDERESFRLSVEEYIVGASVNEYERGSVRLVRAREVLAASDA